MVPTTSRKGSYGVNFSEENLPFCHHRPHRSPWCLPWLVGDFLEDSIQVQFGVLSGNICVIYLTPKKVFWVSFGRKYSSLNILTILSLPFTFKTYIHEFTLQISSLLQLKNPLKTYQVQTKSILITLNSLSKYAGFHPWVLLTHGAQIIFIIIH